MSDLRERWETRELPGIKELLVRPVTRDRLVTRVQQVTKAPRVK
jgi:hypothetical protein